MQIVLLSLIFIAITIAQSGCSDEQIYDLEVLFATDAAGAQLGAVSAFWRATELVRE